MGALPPGFRFHPTDEELVGYYLKRKVEGLEIELEVIPVVDFYKYDPWELPDKSFLPRRDMEWFFFCPRDKKYPNGTRTNRATKAGYWKATGKDRKVVSECSIIGYRKTLVFYQGRAPLGDRTNWVMHEYRLCDGHSEGPPNFKGDYSLCRVIRKTEAKLNTAEYKDLATSKSTNEPLGISYESTSHSLYSQSAYSTPVSSPFDTRPNSNNMWVSPDLILDSSKEYAQQQEISNYVPQSEYQTTATSWHPCNQQGVSPSSSYSNFNGEIEHVDDLSRIGNMTPYSGNVNYMGYFEDEDIQYGCYDQMNSYTGLI